MTMPERVWVTVLGTPSGALHAHRYREAHLDPEPYIPESRLLAAEARVREVEAERDAIHADYVRKVHRVLDLRAERDALAHHILRYGWHEAECPFIHDTLPCHCGFEAIETQARAILAREAK